MALDVGGSDVVRQLVHTARADPRHVVIGGPGHHPDAAGDRAHPVIAQRSLDENGVVRISKREHHVHGLGMVNPGQDRLLVLPSTREIALELSPGVGLDQALQRGWVARIVDTDPEPIAPFMDLP